MPRTMDLTALRSFVAVAEAGGVTRAAGLLNLTQSAVSMQLKRLEEMLGVALFLRAARRMALTPEGEQLLGYARRMVEMNDEAMLRLTCSSFEGEIRLGVPHDIVYPAIPGILKRLAGAFPRVRVNLASSFTLLLKDGFARGGFDAIVTTEAQPGPGGEVLARRNLVWVGATGGRAWHRRPLRLGFKDTCIFRPAAQLALDAAGMSWEMAYDGESEQAIEATLAADLAISARLEGALPADTEVIDSRGMLPDLGSLAICLYTAPTLKGPAAEALLRELHCAYGGEAAAVAA
ncbi:MAG: LysR family transcriptional regulator [Paracoccaceae bacterium]|nr:MAG: LysR family transcriptional regulator [Paracoccaceae bacterium]